MIDTHNTSDNDYQPASQILTLPCSATINVLCWAKHKQDKPVCILLHGLDNNARVWDALARPLSQYFTVYAIDFRGHGDSSWSTDDSYTIQRLTQDIENVCSQLNLHTVYLVGHSLGGRVGAYYSVCYPQRVAALVLGDVGPRINNAAMEKMREDHANAPESFISRESYYHYLKDIYVLAEDDALRQFTQHSLNKKNGRYYSKTDPLCKDAILNAKTSGLTISNDLAITKNLTMDEPFSYPISQLFSSITLPVLLVRGEFSAVLEEAQAQTMLNGLPNGKLATIDIAGHALMMDNPSGTVQAIQRFLLDTSSNNKELRCTQAG